MSWTDEKQNVFITMNHNLKVNNKFIMTDYEKSCFVDEK